MSVFVLFVEPEHSGENFLILGGDLSLGFFTLKLVNVIDQLIGMLTLLHYTHSRSKQFLSSD